MLNAQFYNYAGVINFEMPLDNAAAKAASPRRVSNTSRRG